MADRRRLPDTRDSITRKLTLRYADEAGRLAELDVYVHVGLYEDKTPGEVFMKAGKMGGAVSGLLDALAMSISLGLQSGVPLEAYTAKLRGLRFEPAGQVVNDEDIKIATSVVDAVARWLDKKFPPPPEAAS